MGWLLLLLLGGLAAVPFLRETRRGVPDPQSAPGKRVPLSQGMTHIEWGGPTRGPVVVAIHGLTTPGVCWNAVGAGLGRLGYRLLVYDLYGRGFSDAPRGRQDAAFFLRQLEDLLADQALAGDLTLLGYSMGGSIATAFAAANPDRMKRLILLAPAGIEMHETGFDRFCRRVPLLGDWLHLLLAPARARREITDGPTEVPGIAAIQRLQYARRGFLPAVLSSRRHMLAEVQEAAHRSLGRDGVPVVAIWADQDPVIPISALGRLTQWNRAVRQEVVPGAGHGVVHTHGAAVVELLRGILAE